jgi:diguanylate cyclase (GGDEF)-like protein/excisionase family DNA binding protein
MNVGLMGTPTTRSVRCDGWLRVADAARLLGISRNTLRRWSDSGKLACYRSAGGHRRFRREDVEALLARQHAPAALAGCKKSSTRGEELLTVAALRRRLEDLGAIIDAGREDTEHHSVDDVLRAVARRLAEATHSKVADIYAVEDGTIRALVSYDDGSFDPSWEGRTFHIADYPATLEAIESLQVRVVASLDDPLLTPEVRASLASWGYQSQLSLPLVAHGEVIGLAELSDAVPRDYAEDLHLVRGLAKAAARAIDNARLFEQVERRALVLRELVDIGTLVSRSHDVDELLHAVALRLLMTLDAADCDIYKIQDEGSFTCLASVDRSGYDESVVGKPLRFDLFPLVQEAVRSGAVLTVRDRTDPRLTAEDLAVYDEYGFASELCVPLVVEGRTVGVIEIYDDHPRDFGPFFDFIRSAAQLIGGAMEKALLYQQGQRRSTVLKALVDLGALIAHSPDLDALLREVSRRMTVTIEAADCEVFLADEGGALRCRASYHRDDGFDDDWVGTVLDTDEYPLTGQLAAAGQVLLVTDPDDPRLNPAERAVFDRFGFVSELCIPLVAGERLIGLIDVFDDRERDFVEYLDFITSAGQMVAGALENRFLLEQLRDRNRELSDSGRRREEQTSRIASLLDTSRAITSTLVLEDVLQLVAARAGELLGAAGCYIYEYDADAAAFRWRCEYERDPAYAGGDHIDTAYPFATWPEYELLCAVDVLERHRSDTGLDARVAEEMDTWREKTLVSVPLRFRDQMVGLMEIAEHEEERRFSPDELNLARAFGEQAAAAIRNAQLFRREQEQTERLTLLLESSREMSASLVLDEVLESVARRVGEAFGVCECDIFEYSAGDDTMTCLAEWIRAPAPGEETFVGTVVDLSTQPGTRRMLEWREVTESHIDDENLSAGERAVMSDWGEKSTLEVPLVFDDRSIGSLVLIEKRYVRHFTEEERELLQSLAAPAAVAISNAKAYERRERQTLQLSSLLDASRAITSAIELDESLAIVAREAVAGVGCGECVIYEVDERRGEEVARAFYSAIGDEYENLGKRFPLAEWPNDSALLAKGEILEESLSDPDIHPCSRASMERWHEKTSLNVPLLFGGEAVGIMALVELEQERHFTPDELEIVAALGEQAATAIHAGRLIESLRQSNAELERSARRLGLVSETSMELSSTLDLRDVLVSTAVRLTSTIGVPDCDIYILADDDRLDCVASVADGALDDAWAHRAKSLSLADWSPMQLVIESGRPVVLELADPRLSVKAAEAMREYGQRVLLAVPLLVKDAVIGNVELLDHSCGREFSDSEIELVESICRVAALAIHNADLFARAELRTREAALLNEIARRTTASLELPDIAQAVVEQLAPLYPFERAGFVLRRDGDVIPVFAWPRPLSQAERSAELDLDPRFITRLTETSVLRLELPAESPLLSSGALLRDAASATVVGVFDSDGSPAGALVLTSRSPHAFDASDMQLLQRVGVQLSLAVRNARLYDEIKRLHLSNLKGLSTALTAKDYYTLGHAARVAAYAVMLGHELGWPKALLEQIEEAAYLHDIGKIGVSDRVLLKQGPLNLEEWALMRDHPVISADIIRPLFDEELVLGVRHHHERYDGDGYPDGLAGEDIPPLARAMCIVDSYDAMSLQRPYKAARTYAECLVELRRCAGGQFDPHMVGAFERVLVRLQERRAWAADIAAEGAALVDPAGHALLRVPADERRSEYFEIARRLRELRDARPPVRYITTQVERDGKHLIIVDAEEPESAEHSRLGEEVKADEELPLVLAGQQADVNVIFADGYGVWAAGLAPLRDEAGRIVGAVEVDIPALDIPGLTSKMKQPKASMLETAASRLSRAEIDAITDGLTGLYNHRYLHDRLSEELERARAEGSRLTLLFCDLDHFKDYNDQLGHSTGDRALRAVARIIEQCIRRVDLVARYGGEEFCVVLTETDAAEAQEVAERIRSGVAEASFENGRRQLTISIGLATFPDDADGKEELLDKADWSMYRAKRHGRNQVVAFSLEDLAAGPERVTHTAGHGYLALTAGVVEARDAYATRRGEAVAQLAGDVAAALGLGDDEVTVVVEAARLRDIGEIGVPEHVLNKREALSENEWALIREHPLTGERLLRQLGGSGEVAQAIASHHEWFDGSGYPAGLAGEEIPLAARIVAGACAYNAMVVERPYRPRLSERQALDELRRCAGVQFDPAVISALESVLDAE